MKPVLTPNQCCSMRAQLGWSQVRLAEEACVARSTIEKFEIGQLSGAFTTPGIKRTLLQAGAILP